VKINVRKKIKTQKISLEIKKKKIMVNNKMASSHVQWWITLSICIFWGLFEAHIKNSELLYILHWKNMIFSKTLAYRCF